MLLLAIIADLALNYGGSLFYEYHKSLSAKAAMYISRFSRKLDWSVLDLELISRHFTGHRTISCTVCSSFSHSESLCPRTAYLQTQSSNALFKNSTGTKNFPYNSKQVNGPFNSVVPFCINFKKSVCPYLKCKFLHCCSQ